MGVGSIYVAFSSLVYVPPREESSGRSAGSFPEQRLVIEPRVGAAALLVSQFPEALPIAHYTYEFEMDNIFILFDQKCSVLTFYITFSVGLSLFNDHLFCPQDPYLTTDR